MMEYKLSTEGVVIITEEGESEIVVRNLMMEFDSA